MLYPLSYGGSGVGQYHRPAPPPPAAASHPRHSVAPLPGPFEMRDQLTDVLRSTLVDLGVPAPDEIHLERPARREHGDFSSNVALTTAKSAGRNPRDLAGDIVARPRCRSSRSRDRGRGRRPGVRQLPARRRLATRSGGSRPRGRCGLRTQRCRRRPAGHGRVRLGQPDGSRPCRPRPGRDVRRQPGAAPRLHRSLGRAGVLPERSRRADADVRGVARGPQGRRTTAGGRLSGRVHPGVGRRDARRRRPAVVGRGPGDPRPGAHARPDERRVRHLVLASARWSTRAPSTRRSRTCGPRRGLRRGRCGVAPFDGLRRRQGPRAGQERRRGHVPASRHRVPPRQVRPGLRSRREHLGSGPPRLRGAGAGGHGGARPRSHLARDRDHPARPARASTARRSGSPSAAAT